MKNAINSKARQINRGMKGKAKISHAFTSLQHTT